MKSKIVAIEYVLPDVIETADDLRHENPDWPLERIQEKTGIELRYKCLPNQTTLDLGQKAAEKLLGNFSNKAAIDLLICITQSPASITPPNACTLQDKLGLNTTCAAFDINMGHSGFVYALMLAASMIETGQARQALIVCAETYSKYISKGNRGARPIFSDAAAAVLLCASERNSCGPFELGTDGSGGQDFIISRQTNELHMDGNNVYMFTLDAVPKCVENLLLKANLKITDIDCFIFHQAGKLIIDNIVDNLKIPEAKVFRNYQRLGNTVCASIPIAFKDALDQGRIKSNDRVLLCGFGVGYSWGSCIIEV